MAETEPLGPTDQASLSSGTLSQAFQPLTEANPSDQDCLDVSGSYST